MSDEPWEDDFAKPGAAAGGIARRARRARALLSPCCALYSLLVQNMTKAHLDTVLSNRTCHPTWAAPPYLSLGPDARRDLTTSTSTERR